ncbi:Uncharacterised protein [Serratia marcescens]|nr:Uncharacterised protein [Serratia marcescens]
MMVDGVRQIGQLFTRIADARFARLIGVLHDVAGVGHIQGVANQLHAERRIEPFEEDMLFPAAIGGWAQQGNPVAPFAAFTGLALHQTGDQLLGRAHRFRARPVGFHHQNIAVGQGKQLARVQQTVRHLIDFQAFGHFRHLILLPADALWHLHRRHQEVLRRRQRRIRPHLLFR